MALEKLLAKTTRIESSTWRSIRAAAPAHSFWPIPLPVAGLSLRPRHCDVSHEQPERGTCTFWQGRRQNEVGTVSLDSNRAGGCFPHFQRGRRFVGCRFREYPPYGVVRHQPWAVACRHKGEHAHFYEPNDDEGFRDRRFEGLAAWWFWKGCRQRWEGQRVLRNVRSGQRSPAILRDQSH